MKRPIDDLHRSGLTETIRERNDSPSNGRSFEYYLFRLREKGILYAVESVSRKLWQFLFYRRWILDYAFCPLYKVFHRPRNFVFLKKEYPYFCHSYNTTWKVERAVEIPIVLDFIRSCKGGRVLEVGNVLSRYFPVKHDILDKCEYRKGIINEDLVDFMPAHRYDLIVSISTLEHIGWDETVREPEKIFTAVKRIRSILKPGGLVVATIPLGYNQFLEENLFSGALAFSEIFFMKRVSWTNKWEQCDQDSCRGISYGSPFPAANAIAIILDRKEF